MRGKRIALAIVLALVACKKASEEPASVTTTERGARPPLAEKPFYRVDLGVTPACKAGTPCEAKLVLTALGDYHVNDRYPIKLVADPVAGVTVDSTAWSQDSAKTGTLTVRFRADKPGPAKLTGTFKLSVCTEENCEIDAPAIAFEVTAG